MTEQDFNKKMVMVIRSDLESWQVLNTMGHISAYLANKMKDPFDTGEFFVSRDAMKYPRNSQYAIMAVSAKPGQMQNLAEQVRASGLLNLIYVREMIDTTDDTELQEWLSKKDSKDVEILGIGVFGEKEKVDAITKKFSLWK